MNLQELSFETLEQVKRLISDEHRGGGDIQRDVTTALGLTNYDLQRPAKMLVPVITPLLRMTPRVPGNGDTMTHWRQVTALNTANLEGGIPEGGRNARVTTNSSPKSAAYATIGQEDSVTFEADTAGQGFEDIRANTVMRLLLSEKIAEERMILAGNATALALGTPTMGAVTAAHNTTTPGNFVNGTTYDVFVVALTAAGARASSLGNGVISHVTLTGADGDVFSYGGGSSIPSAAGAVTTGGAAADYSLTAQCTPVLGAAAYAWYAGTNSGTARLAAITPFNSVVINTIPVSPRQLLSALSGNDESKNEYGFDGLLSQAFASGGSITTLPTGTPGVGSTLTPDGAGSIEEIEAFLQAQWDLTHVPPTHLLMGSQQVRDIYRGVIGAGGAPLFRFNIDANNTQDITAGRVIGSFFNKFTADGGSLMKVVLHPDMPTGTVLSVADQIPGVIFPGSNLGTLWEMHMRRDYYQIEWPIRSRKYETGVYAEGVLAHYFPATMSVLTNIAPG